MERNIQVKSKDGFLVNGSLFTNDEAPLKYIVVLASATGVPRQYYSQFALHLVKSAKAVVTFDYRGIGSSIEELKQLKDSIIRREWAWDTDAVIAYLHNVYKDCKVLYIGNSVGGHLVPFLETLPLLSRILFLSVNSAYHQYLRSKYGGYLFYPAFIVHSYLYGYCKASELGLGKDLPIGIGLQWGYWSRFQKYMTHNPETERKCKNVKKQIHVVCFDDDELATKEGMTSNLYWFSNADIKLMIYRSKDLGSVGHLGFFKLPELFVIADKWLFEGERINYKNAGDYIEITEKSKL
ncbi:hypothetical protein HK103_005516 [Boothiomyces macroporosus]|uniref:Alpha/beta hydrolase n=1 Tax=Boothiomyces macroporosus TaxID=261099 RepID=A0AAD5UIV4_9FUNG|nr:hypothetical protein HK103_005516 [Boothiomyces macroporosus]